MVPARNLVGRFRAHHRTGSVPSSRLLATKALFLEKRQLPSGMLRTLESRRPSRPLSESPVSTASRRRFLAVPSESLPSRLLRGRRGFPFVVAVLRPLHWANRPSSIRVTLADRLLLLLCRPCLGDLHSLFEVVKLSVD